MLEAVAIVFTLLSIWLTRKNNILCWICGIIGVICYFYIFKADRSFANMILQIIFFIECIYGWLRWNHKDHEEITKSMGGIVFLELLAACLIAAICYFLNTKFGGELILLDAITTGLSIIGMILIAHKKLEAWIIWGIADIFYVLFFISSGHYWSALLYSILLINAFFGYREWSYYIWYNSIKNKNYVI